MSHSILLYFGSFNPVHKGHLDIAQFALSQLLLHSVWFVLSPQNPFKKDTTLLPAHDRFLLLQSALHACPHCYASKVEFKLARPSYTFKTLRYLRNRLPRCHFSLLLGSDCYVDFYQWENYQEILAHHPIYIYARATHPISLPLPIGVSILPSPSIPLSASWVRKNIANAMPISDLVPKEVAKILYEKKYYL